MCIIATRTPPKVSNVLFQSFGAYCCANFLACSTAAPPNALFKRRMPVIHRSVSVALRSMYVLTSLCGSTRNSLRTVAKKRSGALRLRHYSSTCAPFGDASQHLLRNLLCGQDSIACCYARLVGIGDLESGRRISCPMHNNKDHQEEQQLLAGVRLRKSTSQVQTHTT